MQLVGQSEPMYLIRSLNLSTYNLKHPAILAYLGGFFIIMLIVSWLIGRYALGHAAIDLPFIIINSLVATFVYSFGLNPEKARYDVPN
ncbi:hypothetical protein [Psychrobacter sp. WY6]|uniref:hypothetical protein n=1 Tax=Psychrobacter sp. WY6 TaxID=2708350 RepID=UPI002022DBBC|nr:hypothetical protein [Psychrobacter sp. WY6]